MILYLSGLYFGSKSSHPESVRQTSDEVCTSWAKAQLSGTSQGWRVPRGSDHAACPSRQRCTNVQLCPKGRCLCLWAGWLDLPSAFFKKIHYANLRLKPYILGVQTDLKHSSAFQPTGQPTRAQLLQKNA